MSAYGYKRTSREPRQNVRFAPESRHWRLKIAAVPESGLWMAALPPKADIRGVDGNYLVDVPTTRDHIMDRIANADVPEIEITPEMIAAGKREFCSFYPRFEPEEAAVVRIFRAMMEISKSEERRAVLASSVAPFLAPYLGKSEET